jgi:phenylalanyl-tRNA synthetase beta chain
MIVSWNWLTDYVRVDVAVEILAERLAFGGLNHEGTEEVGGDLAIDLEVTSNRPDCLSHIGVAREIAVLLGKGLTEPSPSPREHGSGIETKTAIAVEAPTLCPRFTARLVSGVQVRESPWWLRKRLETIGVRPISNIVDITNYVMFECGQPLHAYDFDRLAGRRLIVRRAVAGEKLTAINGKEYELGPEMLAIADAERPVGLAGVMGGLDTEIGPTTRNVLIEAAQFDPVSVRWTSRRLGLSSPSSHRFERPMDPARTEWASRRCAELVLELAGGRLHPGVIDVGARNPQRPSITLRLNQIPRVLGIDIARAEVVRILRALGLELINETAEAVDFRPPSWRADLEREIDLIEEVARIHGYHHIAEDRPIPLVRSAKGRRERVESEVRAVLTGLGFDEAVTFSLARDYPDFVHAPDQGGVPPLALQEERAGFRDLCPRRSLMPSLLEARVYNESRDHVDVGLFEIANVYLPRPDRVLPDEPTRLGIIGSHSLLEMKGIVEAILDRLHVRVPFEAAPTSHGCFAQGRQAELRFNGRVLGVIGEFSLEALLANGFELRTRCAGAELDFDALQARAEFVPLYQALPTYPAVSRELSLVLGKDVNWQALRETIRAVADERLESLNYLDVFAGADIPADQHSVHFALRFRHRDRTLTSEEVDEAIQAIVDTCSRKFGAKLR